MNDKEKKKWLADALNRAHVQYSMKLGRPASQAEFARDALDVTETSYSAWINQRRLPYGDNIYKLGDVLGAEFYDMMGLPRHMPSDKLLRRIVDVWYSLGNEEKQHIMDYIDSAAENPNTAAHEGGKTTS